VVLRRLGQLVTYPLRRPFTDLPRPAGQGIAVGLGRALLLLGELRILVALLQDGLIALAAAHHRPSDPPLLPVGSLHAPLPVADVAALVVVFFLLVFLDRQNETWPIHLTGGAPFVEWGRRERALVLPPVDPDLLVLGRPYERTWDDLQNHMIETPLWDQVYTVSQAELCTHATVVAPTRAGKTFNVTIPLIEYTDRVEGSGIFIDAKGDDLTGPLFDADYPGAFHRRFNLLDPGGSFRLQVWTGRTVRERAERLAACLIHEGATDQARYFTHNARAAFINLVLAHHSLYRREPSFPQLLKYLRNDDSRAALIDRLPAQSATVDALRRIEKMQDAKHDVLGGLDALIDPLAHPEITRFFAAPGEGYSIEQFLQAQARACFTLPTGPLPAVAPIIGRIVIGQFTQAVLDPANNTDSLKLLVVEDAANFVTPLLGLAMAQASSHQAAYVLVFQDLSQVRDEALIQDLLTNSGLKIVLGGIGDADSTRFSKLFGTHERLFRSQTASSGRGAGRNQSSGHSHNSGSNHQGTTESRQQSVGWGLIPRSRPDFTATELRQLRDHHAVVERRDNRGHLTPALMIHFDAALTCTLTERQRRDRLGPEAEPLNHLQPLLPVRRPPPESAMLALSEEEPPGAMEPAPPAPPGLSNSDVSPAPQETPPGAQTRAADGRSLRTQAPTAPGARPSDLTADSQPAVSLSAAGTNEQRRGAAIPSDAADTPADSLPASSPSGPFSAEAGAPATRGRARSTARRLRTAPAPISAQVPLPLSAAVGSPLTPPLTEVRPADPVPAPIIPAAPETSKSPSRVADLAQELVADLDFNINDAVFLVRKALQSGYTTEALRGLVAKTAATADDNAQARAALFVRLSVNAPLPAADPLEPAD
jgi:hypothetical protein